MREHGHMTDREQLQILHDGQSHTCIASDDVCEKCQLMVHLRSPHHYRLRSTGHSSAKYGPCEVCGKHCAEVFIQAEYRTTQNGASYYNCRPHLFGHDDCLMGVRR